MRSNVNKNSGRDNASDDPRPETNDGSGRRRRRALGETNGGNPPDEARATTTTAPNANPKSYKICSVLGGLDVARFLSFRARAVFGDVIADVELVREFVAEAMANQAGGGGGGGAAGAGGFARGDDPGGAAAEDLFRRSPSKGLPTLADLNRTLQWEARGLPPGTTTVDAGLGYVDDRPDRSVEKIVFTREDHAPLVGDAASDLAIANLAGLIMPWIVDRRSPEAGWTIGHQDGRSEGPGKAPPPLRAPYLACWFGTYGEGWAYYPPFNRAYGADPLTGADVLPQDYDTRGLPWIAPNLPGNDPLRRARGAKFTRPYADTAQEGTSIITATAPVYFTGSFMGHFYNDTYVASTGIDIALTSVSSLLDVIKDRLAEGSFGLLADVDFNVVAASQSVVELVYPARTGLEEERITYLDKDGTVLFDRRNVTYTPPDTIVEPLDRLENADWPALKEFVAGMPRGGRDYTKLDVTITGETHPTEFYVMVERWEYVADWVLLAFAPVEEVENAISCSIRPERSATKGDEGAGTLLSDADEESPADPSAQSVSRIPRKARETLMLSGERGETLAGEAVFVNDGRLDVAVVPGVTPAWLRFASASMAPHGAGADGGNRTFLSTGREVSVPAGSSLRVWLALETAGLPLGTTSLQLAFRVRDDGYPDCFYDQVALLPLAVGVRPTDCAAATGDPLRAADAATGECVCVLGSTEVWGGRCARDIAVAACLLAPLLVICLGLVYSYVERNKRLSDSIWEVNPGDLLYSDPPEILGRGTFGLVLLGEYRGTKVAVKRVIPPRQEQEVDSGSDGAGKGAASRLNSFARRTLRKMSISIDEEEPLARPAARIDGIQGEMPQRFFEMKLDSVDDSQDEEDGMGIGVDAPKWNDLSQCGSIEKDTKPLSTGMRSGGLSSYGSTSFSVNGTSSTVLWSSLASTKTHTQLKADFVAEMRHLSKLRHPCITTVMGAVISGKEPLLVMELMPFGSAYDLLHNKSMAFEGDLVLSILRDIAQGMRFLHSSQPRVIHGDLKAANVLVDSSFRAKVADFGLSTKKTVGAAGTPYWMAPELLRGETCTTTATDVYSFGIILFEMYSREDPYLGEDCREVLQQVMDPEINKRPPIPSSMPPEVSSLLMQDSLSADPRKRPSFVELDSFLKRFNETNVDPVKATQNIIQAKRNSQIIGDIFPEHIAKALGEGRKVEPEHKECVTVFFSDICGFTDMSSHMPAEKVNDMLDRLFFQFDNLSVKYGVFKIETIGDAWVGAANLDDSQPDHAKRIADFALDVVSAANTTLIDEEHPQKGTVQIRGGFHSGPIVAGVVGTRMPKYTLFGDVMNTGSRMESNSLPGRIQCSDVSAQLLTQKNGCGDIQLVDRGMIPIKGKGEMRTYFVLRKTDLETHNDSTTTVLAFNRNMAAD